MASTPAALAFLKFNAQKVGATASPRLFEAVERQFSYWDASPQKPYINLRTAISSLFCPMPNSQCEHAQFPIPLFPIPLFPK
ncbi:MAG: hypothetical protein F6J93_24980 [Oscillatoria sp. SIO1A7]|nr:hypothetical protein [Oscillatoria sp. SIO1A7]